ncbi:MAG: F0F1 ATP synthase subunit, partial [Rhodanobacter sp.]
MSDRPDRKLPSADQTLAEQVGNKAARKLHARRHGASGVWFGLGMMGLIGWSVAVPTLIGAAIG